MRFILALLLSSTAAHAQSVRQSGNVTPGHPVMWTTTGVIADGGGPTNPALTGLGVVHSGPGICQNSGATSGAYNQLCLGVTSSTAAISLSSIGGASGSLAFTNGSLNFKLPSSNGTSGYVLQTDGAGNTSWVVGGGGGSGSPGGVSGQIQYNNSGSFGGFTMGGDCTFSNPNVTCTKTSGVSFAASATTDATNASNISSGTLGVARGGTGQTSLTANMPLFGNGASAIAIGTVSGNTTKVATVSGSFTSGNCIKADASGNLADNGAACPVVSTPLTAGLPLIGGTGVTISLGARSGNTTTFASTSGSLTAGDCVQIDVSGNLVAAGGPCTTGGGGGTVTSGTAGQITYYATSSTTVSGNPNVNVSAGAVTLGIAGSVIGQLKLTGNTSGTITVTGQAVAGTYNFNLPTGAGTSGQPLLSGGGGASAMTFGTLSVGGGGTGAATFTANGILYGNTTSAVLVTSSVNGAVLNTSSGGTPSLTATPVLGVAGATVGTLGFQNATSGTLTLSPPTGALGTVTVTVPAATDTLVNLAGTQALTGKTYNGLTITTTTGTFTLTSGKTLSVSNTLTLVGTDSTTMTFPSTNGTIASLNIADQTVTGGANVTSQSQSTGNLTVDCGSRPLQYITNGGAYTITAPSNDGSCILLSTNNGSAGAITFSGFSVGSSTGDSLTTTNTSKFSVFIWRINGTSGYRVAAHQ